MKKLPGTESRFLAYGSHLAMAPQVLMSDKMSTHHGIITSSPPFL